MIDQAKLQLVFSDKEYVEGIARLSAEDAAKSLNEIGLDITAADLMQLRNFLAAHQDGLQNGELPEDALAGVAGGTLDVIGGVLCAVGSVLPRHAALYADSLAW